MGIIILQKIENFCLSLRPDMHNTPSTPPRTLAVRLSACPPVRLSACLSVKHLAPADSKKRRSTLSACDRYLHTFTNKLLFSFIHRNNSAMDLPLQKKKKPKKKCFFFHFFFLVLLLLSSSIPGGGRGVLQLSVQFSCDASPLLVDLIKFMKNLHIYWLKWQTNFWLFIRNSDEQN